MKYIAQPGGSVRDDHVIETCNKYGPIVGLLSRQTCTMDSRLLSRPDSNRLSVFHVTYGISDGVIAPGYEPEALEILKGKKNGNYNVIQIDPDYVPEPLEHKDVFGITFEQGRNEPI